MKPKILDILSSGDAAQRVPKFKEFGYPDTWKKIHVAASEAEQWGESTEGLQTPFGVVLRVSRTQKNNDGTYTLSDTCTFVPGVMVVPGGAGLHALAPIPQAPPQNLGQVVQQAQSHPERGTKDAPNLPHAIQQPAQQPAPTFNRVNGPPFTPPAPPPEPTPPFPVNSATITEQTPGSGF